MDRAVFAVDGNDLRTGHREQRLHDGTSRDQALLVGECESLACTQCRDGEWQTREADDTVGDDVGTFIGAAGIDIAQAGDDAKNIPAAMRGGK